MTPLLTTRRAALGAGLALAGARALAQASVLTDEQRSALKQAHADPTWRPTCCCPNKTWPGGAEPTGRITQPCTWSLSEAAY